MNQYEVVNGPLTLPPGLIVRLTEQQANLREHALKKRKNGCYEVIHPVQFKNGETLGFDQVPDKTLLAAFFSPEQIIEMQNEIKIPTKKQGE